MPDRYLKPGWWTNRVANPLISWFVKRGLPLKGAAILEVTGRKSGEPRTTPVNPLRLDSERYLVAPRGVTEWVRNIRISGIPDRSRRRLETTPPAAREFCESFELWGTRASVRFATGS